MIMVSAIIRPQMLGEVQDALESLGIHGMTVSEVRGMGRQKGITERYRGQEYTVNLLPKTKVEVVVPDEEAEHVVDAIVKYGRTGEIGDGKIFLIPVSGAVRVRTGEQGGAAL